MAKVRDENGREIEGRSVVTETQAEARKNWETRLRIKRERVLWSQLAKKSPQEQLALLDKRLGIGKGAGKERARLQAML